MPVINENDTTATEEISFGDNDFLAAQVAILVGADRLVLLTNQDGLHTADPRTNADAELVREIADVGQLAGLQIGQSPSALGSGGMRSKVVAAEMATAAGIPTTICSGLRHGVLARALAGEAEGTMFAPQSQRYSSFELWLKYAKPARGTIVVDAGAARALRRDGASLLPVGVVEVRGGFDPGDAVEVSDGASVIGKGISSYSAGGSAARHREAERRRPRGPATRRRRGDPPRLLRPGMSGEEGGELVVLVSSPLLVPHVRSAGGSGGRRIRAGVVGAARTFALSVEAGGRAPSLRTFGSALACAHAFNDELRRAARDGLHSRPPAQSLTAEALHAASDAILG